MDSWHSDGDIGARAGNHQASRRTGWQYSLTSTGARRQPRMVADCTVFPRGTRKALSARREENHDDPQGCKGSRHVFIGGK